MGEQKSYKWFLDLLSPHEAHIHGIEEILLSKQTKFQQMDILKTRSYGLCLMLDGKVQSSECDEFIYHEGLVHPALLMHPNPKRIFIVGGGEGATSREALRHRTVERVLMVDIDEEVVEGCRKLMPSLSDGAFEDPRHELRYMDARKYLEETNDQYDIIIIDISEPVEEGPAYLLFTKEFYQIVQKRLTPDGVISLQAGTTAVGSLQCFSSVYQTLKSVFPIVRPYQASIPSFGLPWGFAMASNTLDPMKISDEELNRRIANRIKGQLKYYDGETHRGQFLLSKIVRERMECERKIIEDNHPLFIYN